MQTRMMSQRRKHRFDVNGFEEPLRHLLDPNSERVVRLGKSATPGFPILGAGTNKSQLLLLQGIPQITIFVNLRLSLDSN